jgi:hypothetical protein
VAGSPRPTRESQMSKGQIKKTKEVKKPKSEKPKTEVSAYKRAQGKGGESLMSPNKK